MNISRPQRTDIVRAVAVLVAALTQFAAGAVGGSGVADESVGDAARSYANPILPAGTAFLIWNVIYLAFLAYAVWQLLPSQRGRTIHRRTGWWLVAVGVLNAGWVGLFVSRQVWVSQIVIVALLAMLTVAWRRATSVPRTTRRPTQLLLWAPLTLYTGWVLAATAVGALTTVAALGDDGAGTVTGAVALVLVGVVSVIVVLQAVAVVGFVISMVWALAWIAAESDDGVAVTSMVVALLVVLVLAVRLLRARDRSRAAFG